MTGPRAAAISLREVSKAYGGTPAVSSLSLEVEAGELVAVVGPNGAGKTTTIEMMEGYRRPDRGSIAILGLDPVRQAAKVRQLVGLMLQEGGIYPTIKVGEALGLFASYYSNPEPAPQLLELVGLTELTQQRYRQLSGGEKQRLSLALALVGRPKVLFLDEPTAGMDPRARLITWEIVKGRQLDGVTVMLTTHSMEEAEQLADRVAIMKEGRLVAYDTPERLRGGSGPDLLHIKLRERLPEELLLRLGSLAAVDGIEERGHGTYDLSSRDPARVAVALTGMLLDHGIQFNELRIGRSSLEEVFLSLTEEESH